MPRPLVSIVIASYNPKPFLLETLDSVAAQTYRPVETILVNDGTDDPESLAVLHGARRRVDRHIEQLHLGVSTARNVGFRAARGRFVLPLDDDDKMGTSFVKVCVAALESHPEAAFVYTDYEMFGEQNRTCRVPDYNLWDLVHRNTVCSFSLIRRAEWELVGGYDENSFGYEDWDLWLRLAERGRHGLHLPRVLFHYRKQGRSVSSRAYERHAELVGEIRARHPMLYSPESLARIRKQWGVQVCVLSDEPVPVEAQSIEDVDLITGGVTRHALAVTRAPAFLIPPRRRPPARHSAEQCALAVWAGRSVVCLEDGSLGLSRAALGRVRVAAGLSAELQAELARLGWRRDREPAGEPIMTLQYSPRRTVGRRYTALLVSHLGPCVAALEVARAQRNLSEIFIIATDTVNAVDRHVWERASDGVYDLAELVRPARRAFALHALVSAWKFDTIVVAGSRLGYSIMSDLRPASPGAKIVELIDAEGPEWNAERAAISFHAAPDVRVVLGGRAPDLTAAQWEAGLSAEGVPGGVQTISLAPGQVRKTAVGPDRLRREGDPLPLPSIPAVGLRFGDGLELTGLRFSHKVRVATLELCWRCRERIGRPLRCFTQFVDTTGTVLASADHQILRGCPPTTEWTPGDEGFETRQMVLPGGSPTGLQLYLSIFDDETGLRLPLQASTVPLRDHYTAAVFEPHLHADMTRRFAMEPAPRIPCEAEFEHVMLNGYSWRVQDGVGWLRLWWQVTAQVDQRLSFFGHAVAEISSAAPTLTSFDQELRVERLHSVPQELVYDIVRDVSGWTAPVQWLRAGVFNTAPPFKRLGFRHSSFLVSQAESAVYLPLASR